jgi:outer membrane biosynthesis protein TonB
MKHSVRVLALLLVLFLVPAARAQGTEEVTGTVTSIESANGIVVLDDGRRIRVVPATVILVDGKPVSVATVVPGNRVVIRQGQMMGASSAQTMTPGAAETRESVTVQTPAPKVNVQIPRQTVIVEQQPPQITVQQQPPEVVVQPAPPPQVQVVPGQTPPSTMAPRAEVQPPPAPRPAPAASPRTAPSTLTETWCEGAYAPQLGSNFGACTGASKHGF